MTKWIVVLFRTRIRTRMVRLLDESPWQSGFTHRSNPQPLLLSVVVLLLSVVVLLLSGAVLVLSVVVLVLSVVVLLLSVVVLLLSGAVLVLVIEFPSNGANSMFVITSVVGRKVKRLPRATFLASMPGQVDDALGGEMRFIEPRILRALTEDADFFSQVAMQVQSRSGRDPLQDLTLSVD